MADKKKQPNQAMPQHKADPAEAEGSGRKGGGESGGGAYEDPDQVEGDPGSDGFLGHGGQSHIDYSGPDNPNATTGS